MGKCELNACGSEQGPVAGSCEHGNDPSGSIKGKEFLDWATVSFSRTLLHVISALVVNTVNSYNHIQAEICLGISLYCLIL
jgi:hypothetical protein